MEDDGGYFDEDGEWWLDDFGVSQDDVAKIHDSMKIEEEKTLKQTLALMAVDNQSPSEHGLTVLKQYSSGEISYTQAIEEIKNELLKSKPTNLY